MLAPEQKLAIEALYVGIVGEHDGYARRAGRGSETAAVEGGLEQQALERAALGVAQGIDDQQRALARVDGCKVDAVLVLVIAEHGRHLQ